MAVGLDEIMSLRQRIEEAAQSPDLGSGEKLALLTSYRDDVDTLLGLIDTYMGDERLVRQAQVDDANLRLLRVRDNADLREALISRGLATAEQLDEAGYLSHDELDRLEREGLLESVIDTLPLAEAAAVHRVSGIGNVVQFDPRLHPRDRAGKFSEVLGKMAKGDRAELPGGIRVHKQTDHGYEVETNGRRSGGRVTQARAAKAALDASAQSLHPESLGGTTSFPSHADYEKAVEAKTPKPPGETSPAPPKPGTGLNDDERKRLNDEYIARSAELNRRVAERVESGLSSPTLDPAEVHFNEAGHVSQRGLAQFVDSAAAKPTTVKMYSRENPDGTHTWDASRRELHERIITAYLKKRKWDPNADGGKGDYVLDYSPDAEDLPSQSKPEVLFSGGGYAAGKGSTLKILKARGDVPPDSVTLDPDVVKAQLPEFQEALKTGDPEGNMRVYQEAWEIAQEIQARAQDKRQNIIVDGISDTSPDEMLARWDSFKSRGYKGRAVYVNIPTEEALRRAAYRAQNAKSESDRRMIPEVIMRAVHRDVSATVPNMARMVAEKKLGLDVSVWDNDQGKDDTGAFRPPKEFYRVDGMTGKEQVIDQDLWDRFRAKAHETIPLPHGEQV